MIPLRHKYLITINDINPQILRLKISGSTWNQDYLNIQFLANHQKAHFIELNCERPGLSILSNKANTEIRIYIDTHTAIGSISCTTGTNVHFINNRVDLTNVYISKVEFTNQRSEIIAENANMNISFGQFSHTGYLRLRGEAKYHIMNHLKISNFDSFNIYDTQNQLFKDDQFSILVNNLEIENNTLIELKKSAVFGSTSLSMVFNESVTFAGTKFHLSPPTFTNDLDEHYLICAPELNCDYFDIIYTGAYETFHHDYHYSQSYYQKVCNAWTDINPRTTDSKGCDLPEMNSFTASLKCVGFKQTQLFTLLTATLASGDDSSCYDTWINTLNENITHIKVNSQHPVILNNQEFSDVSIEFANNKQNPYNFVITPDINGRISSVSADNSINFIFPRADPKILNFTELTLSQGAGISNYDIGTIDFSNIKQISLDFKEYNKNQDVFNAAGTLNIKYKLNAINGDFNMKGTTINIKDTIVMTLGRYEEIGSDGKPLDKTYEMSKITVSKSRNSNVDIDIENALNDLTLQATLSTNKYNLYLSQDISQSIYECNTGNLKLVGKGQDISFNSLMRTDVDIKPGFESFSRLEFNYQNKKKTDPLISHIAFNGPIVATEEDFVISINSIGDTLTAVSIHELTLKGQANFTLVFNDKLVDGKIISVNNLNVQPAPTQWNQLHAPTGLAVSEKISFSSDCKQVELTNDLIRSSTTIEYTVDLSSVDNDHQQISFPSDGTNNVKEVILDFINTMKSTTCTELFSPVEHYRRIHNHMLGQNQTSKDNFKNVHFVSCSERKRYGTVSPAKAEYEICDGHYVKINVISSELTGYEVEQHYPFMSSIDHSKTYQCIGWYIDEQMMDDDYNQ
ncbi:hypothetical protein TRFO_15319 [Tritrichomonas foetus]|uniref:Uncharacterized protein n=1 Tax=Tritrichomonas foetus TaxID=1144522 RepID=A0A1J4KTZ7_9EUKA|nr:hypothetical protein TRFO_15319 [Tritrichomonas foetus]|eukprot:OHT14384.1 hypothetical protein TRFO_15319 [Tritrichomonas foetus]